MSRFKAKLRSITLRQKGPIQVCSAPNSATRAGSTPTRGNVVGCTHLSPYLRHWRTNVLPHVGSLVLLQHERGSFHAQRLEYWAEQERLPNNWDAMSARLLLNPHDAQVTVVTAQLEPEFDCGRVSRHL